MSEWQTIETAPKETKEMFVVRAFDIPPREAAGWPYTSDAYCVWTEKGRYVRWPHAFEPTHWMPLPKATK